MKLRVQSLASLSGFKDPALTWAVCRSAAVTPTRSLAWEHPYAVGATLKRQKKKKKKINKNKWVNHMVCEIYLNKAEKLT